MFNEIIGYNGFDFALCQLCKLLNRTSIRGSVGACLFMRKLPVYFVRDVTMFVISFDNIRTSNIFGIFKFHHMFCFECKCRCKFVESPCSMSNFITYARNEKLQIQ